MSYLQPFISAKRLHLLFIWFAILLPELQSPRSVMLATTNLPTEPMLSGYTYLKHLCTLYLISGHVNMGGQRT
jgi:hypothetical protein